MSAPAGWYPDPQRLAPGQPPQQRYWDGQGWTGHVAPIAPQPAYGQPASAQSTYAAQGAYAAGVSPYAAVPTTPDGARLAGWWQRVGAYLIDGLILGVVVSAVAFPFIRDVLSAFADFFDEAMTAAENGTPLPSSAQLERDIAGAAAAIAVIGLVINLVYTAAFLSWKQATPGKLALGLRVRLRERPELPMSAILLRWATQTGVPGLLGLVPVVSLLVGVFSLLDVLWPLWDSKRQALHDKVAKTNVIRVR